MSSGVPAGAVVFDRIEEKSGWQTCGNCGNDGAAGSAPQYGLTQGISQPSLDGSSTDFYISGPAYTGGYYWITHPNAPHVGVSYLRYEFSLYIPAGQENAPQAIEFECQQSAQGLTYNFAWQAEYPSRTWRVFNYTTKHWEATSIPFTPFTPNVWHHIVALYHTEGNVVVHDSLEIDGQVFNAGIRHDADPKGESDYITNAFQLDLNSQGTPYHVYVDQMKTAYLVPGQAPAPAPTPTQTQAPAPSGSNAVSISSPGDGATVAPSFPIAAACHSGDPVDAIQIYLDGNLVYDQHQSSLSTSLSAGAGSHAIEVKCWDLATGNPYSQMIHVTVANPQPAPQPTPTMTQPPAPVAASSVSISAPMDGAMVDPSFAIAGACHSGDPVDAIQIYLDGNLAYDQHQSSLSTSLSAGAGSHAIEVKCWDLATGNPYSQMIHVTVVNPQPTPTMTQPPAPVGANSVSISSPMNGANVGSSFALVAACSSADPVDAIQIYLDGNLVYDQKQSSLNTMLSPGAGTHGITVKCWDQVSGSPYSQHIQVNVGSNAPPTPTPTPTMTQTPPPAGNSVSISAPADGASVPASFDIAAACHSADPVDAIQIYLDGNLVYDQKQSSLNTMLSAGAGSHAITVKCWDQATGAEYSQHIQVSVSSSTPVTPPSPTETPTITPTPTQTPSGVSGSASVPQFDHVIMVVEENHSYDQVIGSSSAPYMNQLANQYGLATQYYADTHPSIGNYMELTTGQIITNDDGFTGTVSVDNVVRRLIAAGKSWKSYAEGLPSVGYTGGDTGRYVIHHNPLAYFSDVRNSSTERANLVGFDQFAGDLAAHRLPNFATVIPNLDDDAHDGTLLQADQWLKTNIGPLIASPDFQNTLLVIVFDEAADSDTTHGGGHATMIVVSPKSKPAFRSNTFYQNAALLRMSLQALGISSFPGDAASAPDMSEFFQ